MKKTLKLMVFAMLAFGMMACSEKQLTIEDMEEAQASLFNENQTMNLEIAPKVAKQYCRFVKQNPNDPNAPALLFHAIEINVALQEPDKCIEIGDQLMKQYPESIWAPRTLFCLANYVYDEQLHDLDKARETYERLISDYPNSDLVEAAQKSIEYLGMSPDQILERIMVSQMEVEDSEL